MTNTNPTTEPRIWVVQRTSYNTRFRAVGEPTAPDWAKSRRLANEPWCEFTIWHNDNRLSSFGGEVWPSAWPELFHVGPRTIYGQTTTLTAVGESIIREAIEQHEARESAMGPDHICDPSATPPITPESCPACLAVVMSATKPSFTPGCGCCLEPVNDATEASDLCSEATGTNNGIGWKIKRCSLHAAAPSLYEALKAFDEGLRDGSVHFTRKRQADTDPYHPANVAMCAALALVDGEADTNANACEWTDGENNFTGPHQFTNGKCATCGEAEVMISRTARRTSYKRASFREGVRWIAFNDEPTVTDQTEIAALITVALLADLFGKSTEHVALHVARERTREAQKERPRRENCYHKRHLATCNDCKVLSEIEIVPFQESQNVHLPSPSRKRFANLP